MVLAPLQTLLSELYALDVGYDVHDFLVTDARVAAALDRDGRELDEKLLIAEGAGETSVSLYLDAALVERLHDNHPIERLGPDNLGDFWTALEGVSHFLYYVSNAVLEKPVTLMEMELQAEVDKFIAAALLLQRQGERVPANLHGCLFDVPTFDARLGTQELDRYRSANRYAGKYCMKLAARLESTAGRGDLEQELCYFYRLPQPHKLRHIDAA